MINHTKQKNKVQSIKKTQELFFLYKSIYYCKRHIIGAYIQSIETTTFNLIFCFCTGMRKKYIDVYDSFQNRKKLLSCDLNDIMGITEKINVKKKSGA